MHGGYTSSVLGDDGQSTSAWFKRRVRSDPLECGIVTTVALTSSDGSPYTLSHETSDIAISSDGTFFVGIGQSIVKIGPDGVVDSFVGHKDEEGDQDEVGDKARFNGICGFTLSHDGSKLFLTELGNHKIRVVDVEKYSVNTLAGSGFAGDIDGVGSAAHFNEPVGITLSPDGGTLFVVDGANCKIKKVQVDGGLVTTLAGSGEEGDQDGIGAAATFRSPAGIALSKDGGTLYVADSGNHKVKSVKVESGLVANLAGSGESRSVDGIGAAAGFEDPSGVVVSRDGSSLFVTDTEGNCVRWVKLAGRHVSTVAGSGHEGDQDGVGLEAMFSSPDGIAVSGDGASVLIACSNSNDSLGLIRRVNIGRPQLEIPCSTLVNDLKRTRGDATLPTGLVTFVVGPERARIEHISKSIICARSEYFANMFRNPMKESRAEEVEIPDASAPAFDSLIDYLISDEVKLDTSTSHAFDTMLLARKYQVERLELLCQEAIENSVGTANVVPLLIESCRWDNERLVSLCRQFVLRNGREVLDSGALERLSDLGIAKGLLEDALHRIGQLEGTVTNLRSQVDAWTYQRSARTHGGFPGALPPW